MDEIKGYENVSYDNRMIRLSAIQPPEYALREAQIENASFLNLKDSIRKHGIIHNLAVVELQASTPEKPMFGIIDGLQRYTALKQLHPEGEIEVPCRVMAADEAAIAELQIIANGVHIETQPVQFTIQLRRILTSNPLLSQSELAAKLNMSVKWLNDRLSLGNLSDAAKDLVDKGAIRLNHAFTLAKLQPKPEQDTFLVDAQNDTYPEFAGKIEARIKEIRKANQAGRAAGERQFVAVPVLRKINELTTVLENPESDNAVRELIALENPTTLVDAFKLGIKYSIQLDPTSIATKKAKDAQLKAERDAQNALKREQQAKISAERALARAQELGVTAQLAAAE